MPQFLPQALPRWVVLTGCLISVAVVGYLDYITGDYSILIFYLIPVSFASWYNGRWSGVCVSCASGIARVISDSYLYRNILLHAWNSLQDLIFFLIVGLLVSLLRQELGRSDEG